ncbi:MAG: response regulator, partial [Gammaproteobacteria bacterium]|nr:response regulator [Gammaproteobacteria bacterium]
MLAPNPQILIVDDDPVHGASVRDVLTAHSYNAHFTEKSQEGLELLRQGHYQVLILDLNMPGTSGMDILEELAAKNADIKTIVLSGESTLDSVTPILRLGAYDFLHKPFEAQLLLTSVSHALDHYELEERNRSMAAEAEASHELHEFLVNSTPDIIYMLDENGNFKFINNKLSNLFKVEPKDLEGESWEKLLGDRLATVMQHRFDERRTGSRATSNYEFDFQAPD